MKKIFLTLSTLILSITANADTITASCSTTLFDISSPNTGGPSNNYGFVEKIFILNEASSGQDHFKNGFVLARGTNVLISLIRGINSPNELVLEVLQSKSLIAKNIENPDRFVDAVEYQLLSRPFAAAGESKVTATGTIGSEGFTVNCEIQK